MPVSDAEDCPADDLEGQGAHPIAHRELRTPHPARHLRLGDLADHLAERMNGRTLKGRQQELALAKVPRPVEDQDRVVAEHW